MLSMVIPVYFLVLCTAYSASFDECGKTDGITASGIKAIEGETVAADDLPLGTKIEIEGHIYTVHDRFGGGYKGRIDIYKEKKSDCIRFGKQFKAARIVYMPEKQPFEFFLPDVNAIGYTNYYF